ncbi:adenylate kinase [Actinomadura kijaniata]|uniref:adenylate kinase n=1 Tax=Actinomadura kijaniata TaxID=46161 RepID=UPI000832860F|nr:adenylate kinase [Actinomadura kijaniata]
MRRVLVAGISGAGKSTLADRLAEHLDLPRHELDAMHHGPGWTPRPEFVDEVRAFAATDRWICEDQYHGKLGDLLWERADTVIWLDLPRRTVMFRVLRRSFGRALFRRELWNGNRERWRDWADPDHPVRWAWSQYDRKRAKTAERIARHPGVRVVHLRTARRTRRLDWLEEGEWSSASTSSS